MSQTRYLLVSGRTEISRHGKKSTAKHAAVRRVAAGEYKGIDVIQLVRGEEWLLGRVYREDDKIVWSPV